MLVAIASDHRGFELKNKIKEYYKDKYEFKDLGTYSSDSCDYPDFGFKLGEYVRDNSVFGIAICGSGIGISIACNKVKGIRCAKVSNADEAYYTRNDNDANIVAFSGDTSLEDAISIIDKFLNTPFSNIDRHKRRINKISLYEEGKYEC